MGDVPGCGGGVIGGAIGGGIITCGVWVGVVISVIWSVFIVPIQVFIILMFIVVVGIPNDLALSVTVYPGRLVLIFPPAIHLKINLHIVTTTTHTEHPSLTDVVVAIGIIVIIAGSIIVSDLITILLLN